MERNNSFSRRRLIATAGLCPILVGAADALIISRLEMANTSLNKLVVIEANFPGGGRTRKARERANTFTNHVTSDVKYMLAHSFCNEMIYSLRNNKMHEFRQSLYAPKVLIIDDAEHMSGKQRTQEELHWTIKERSLLDKWTIVTRLLPEGSVDIERRLASVLERGLVIVV